VIARSKPLLPGWPELGKCPPRVIQEQACERKTTTRRIAGKGRCRNAAAIPDFENIQHAAHAVIRDEGINYPEERDRAGRQHRHTCASFEPQDRPQIDPAHRYEK